MNSRNAIGAILAALVLSAAMLSACGPGGSKACEGSEGCACYRNMTCDQGLSCLSKLCVNAGGSGGAAGMGGRGGTGAGGTGGVSGAGGSSAGSAAGSSGTAGIGAAGGLGGSGGSAGTGGSAGAGGGGGTAGTAGAGGSGGTGGASGTGGAGGPGGGGQALDCTPLAGTIPPLKLTLVKDGFAHPLLVKSPPGDNTRLFVVEQGGTIRVIENGVLKSVPFLDISTLLQNAGERGLLGLAFHPDYAQNRRFFVHFSRMSDSATMIDEYRRSATDPNVADPTPVAHLLDVEQPYANNKGGSIEFGPDRMLYIGLGDGGAADPMANAQNINSLLGKILRVDVSTTPYSIPTGNLTGGKPEIWDYGLRNPYRFNFDACTGDLYIADDGLNTTEEINVEPAGAGRKNYGWNVVEGSACVTAGCVVTGFTMPTAQYADGANGCAVIGGYVYRGHAIPGLRGRYLYSDFCTGAFSTFSWSNGLVSNAATIAGISIPMSASTAVSSFGQDAAGELYVTTLAGEVFRIAPM
jgi:glucose/arabinose dehydrogenase